MYLSTTSGVPFFVSRALLLVGDISGLARAVFGSNWRWELIKVCVDHFNAMFAEYAVMVNQAVDSDKRSPFYIAEKYGRGESQVLLLFFFAFFFFF